MADHRGLFVSYSASSSEGSCTGYAIFKGYQMPKTKERIDHIISRIETLESVENVIPMTFYELDEVTD